MSIVKKVDSPNLDRFRPKKRRWWLWALLLIVIAAIAWYLIPLIVAYNSATTGNDSSNDALKQNAQGKYNQINVLLLGTNANLSDSIIVASIDPETKTVSMLSIPRDLYINDDTYGKLKINEIHSRAEGASKTKGNGAKKLKEVVAQTFGIPIHYFVRVDFDGFKKIVDSIGGIDVDVKTALSDGEYPCDNDPTKSCGFSIKAGKQHINGTTALKYTRCRKGNCGSDFGRAMRQQEVLKAIRAKALSAQVLANPKKVTDLISALGTHMLMDISATELTQSIALARSLGNPTMRSHVFGASDGLVETGNIGGKSVVVPTAGASDYSELQAFAQAYIQQPRIAAEKPTVLVRQGSATKSTVAKVVKHLEWAGFTVSTATEPDPSTTTTMLYSQTTAKPTSTDYLKDTYKVTTQKGTSGLSTETVAKPTPSPASSASPSPSNSPVVMTDAADYELVVGSDIAKILKESKPLEDNADGQDALQSPPAETSYAPGAPALVTNIP